MRRQVEYDALIQALDDHRRLKALTAHKVGLLSISIDNHTFLLTDETKTVIINAISKEVCDDLKGYGIVGIV